MIDQARQGLGPCLTQKDAMHQRQSFKKILKITLLSVFFTFIILFSFFRSFDLIFGVKIKEVSIEEINGTKVVDNIVNVKGRAKNATSLKLNGREISIDKAGYFNETIALLSGYNIITIEAQDKFKHTDIKNYQLIY